MATSEGIPSSIDIEFLELNDNPYNNYYDSRYLRISITYKWGNNKIKTNSKSISFKERNRI